MARDLKDIDQILTGLRSSNKREMTQACDDLKWYRNDDPKVDGAIPILTGLFDKEQVQKTKSLLAELIVRFSESSTLVKGLIDELSVIAVQARTKEDKSAALNLIQLAAKKGWDVSSCMAVLRKFLFEGWEERVLEIFSIAVATGADVFAFTSDGIANSEVIKLILNDIRRDVVDRSAVLRLLTVAADCGLINRVADYREDVKRAGQEQLRGEFHKEAAVCLAAIDKSVREAALAPNTMTRIRWP